MVRVVVRGDCRRTFMLMRSAMSTLGCLSRNTFSDEQRKRKGSQLITSVQGFYPSYRWSFEVERSSLDKHRAVVCRPSNTRRMRQSALIRKESFAYRRFFFVLMDFLSVLQRFIVVLGLRRTKRTHRFFIFTIEDLFPTEMDGWNGSFDFCVSYFRFTRTIVRRSILGMDGFLRRSVVMFNLSTNLTNFFSRSTEEVFSLSSVEPVPT